jgi:spermidine synthase
MNVLTIPLHAHAKTVRLVYPVIFVCFFLSGFCSLLYQVLWTRFAFAEFGIITPVLSLIISVFMLGLGIGSAYGGRLATSGSRTFGISPLYLYAAAESLVAIGAFAVPSIFGWCGTLLLHAGASSSAGFLLLSAACIIITLLPWCVAMGATIPLMMTFARSIDRRDGGSFSFLYAASVLGAATGAAMTALVLMELVGLRGTSTLGAIGNLAIALTALALARLVPTVASESATTAREPDIDEAVQAPRWLNGVLFITGFSSVGMEVCWARDFTAELMTTIYAFAAILATYLFATFLGSFTYRRCASKNVPIAIERSIAWLFPLSLLPVLLADPRADHSVIQTLLSIVPLCGLLGFLTPGLIDRFSHGDATRAGHFYAINIAGGILGPLAAGYFLLPYLGIRWAMILLALPLLAASLLTSRFESPRRSATLATSAALAAIAVFSSRAYDDGSIYPPNEVHRDYATSVVAFGSGPSAQLLVNAIPITSLTTDTKEMAHLPMALRGHPHNALDICFGMGTTFRSLSTWGVDTTAVDLSPSVIASFGFFYADAAAILASPRNHTLADDGRRYLMRTDRQFDVITLDPPPPAEASGSSLLYSVRFYDIAKRRLAPGGVLAQWLPRTEPRLAQSVALAIRQSFPYVLVFSARNGSHFIASMTPLRVPSSHEFVNRMPAAARRDFVEWEGSQSPQTVVQEMLSHQVTFESMLPAQGSNVPTLSDDRPYNEYFFLRRSGLID